MKTKFTKICVSFLMFFALTLSAYAQQITGTVSDENGVPLPGATVIVQGTSNGVSTDFDGNYSITVEDGATLSASYVGYQATSILVDGQDQINFTLTEGNQLDEVIVTG